MPAHYYKEVYENSILKRQLSYMIEKIVKPLNSKQMNNIVAENIYSIY